MLSKKFANPGQLQSQLPSVFTLLLHRFNGCPVVPLKDGLESINYPLQTARNQRTQGCFPIPVVPRGSRLFVEVAELAKYAVRGKEKKRGRPTKASKMNEGGAS